MSGEEIIQTMPIGKYRGKSVLEAVQDRNYIEWLLQQPWFKERHPKVHINITSIINNSGMISDVKTPEHNKLQAMFLEDEEDVLKKLIKSYDWTVPCNNLKRERLKAVSVLSWLKSIDLTQSTEKDGYFTKEAREKAPRLLSELIKKYQNLDSGTVIYNLAADAEVPLGRFFADCLVSVKVRNIHTFKHSDGNGHTEHTFFQQLGYLGISSKPPEYIAYEQVDVLKWYIELKPTVGDDYPHILRKVRQVQAELGRGSFNEMSYVVVTESYSGSVSLAAVRKMFKTAGVEFLLLSDISVDREDKLKLARYSS